MSEKSSCMTKAGLGLLIASGICSNAIAQEALPAQIELNGQVMGDFIVLKEGADSYWVREADFSALRLLVPVDAPVHEERGITYRLLLCDGRKITCEIDLAQARLKIHADPSLFVPSSINLYQEDSGNTNARSDNGGFINYAMHYTASQSQKDVFHVPLEIGWRAGQWLALGDFSYQSHSVERRPVRLSTRLIHDNHAAMTRLILGDFSANTGPLGGGGTFGGVSFAKDYSLDPLFVRLPGLELSGILDTPSEVEVLIDGQRVTLENLPAGPFDLQDIMRQTGLTDAVMIIRDPFGNERRVDTSVYVAGNLLRIGVQEFGYHFGFRREGFGTVNSDYTDWAALVYHRFGVYRNVTLGFRGEIDGSVANLGGDSALRLGNWGELSTDLALSQASGLKGAAAQALYHYGGREFSLTLSGRSYTRDYATLSMTPDNAKLRYQGRIDLTYRFEKWGGVSASLSQSQWYDEDKEQNLSLRYSRSFGNGLSISSSWSHDFHDETDSAFLSLSYFLGNRTNVSYQHNNTSGRSAQNLSIHRGAMPYKDFGYRFGLGRRGRDNRQANSYDGEVSYNGVAGEYRLGYRNNGSSDQWSWRAAGGVALIGGGPYFSRPIRTSFAVVDTGLKGIDVKLNNNLVAVTNRSGKALVPGLGAYQKNRISIDISQLPIDQFVEKEREDVVPHFRSGIKVDLPIRRIRAVVGILLIESDKKVEAAEFWELKVMTTSGPHRYMIGTKGQFYIDDLDEGRYEASIYLQERVCRFSLEIPETNKPYTNIGEVICEIE